MSKLGLQCGIEAVVKPESGKIGSRLQGMFFLCCFAAFIHTLYSGTMHNLPQNVKTNKCGASVLKISFNTKYQAGQAPLWRP